MRSTRRDAQAPAVRQDDAIRGPVTEWPPGAPLDDTSMIETPVVLLGPRYPRVYGLLVAAIVTVVILMCAVIALATEGTATVVAKPAPAVRSHFDFSRWLAASVAAADTGERLDHFGRR
jgi:hypothetical protein